MIVLAACNGEEGNATDGIVKETTSTTTEEAGTEEVTNNEKEKTDESESLKQEIQSFIDEYWETVYAIDMLSSFDQELYGKFYDMRGFAYEGEIRESKEEFLYKQERNFYPQTKSKVYFDKNDVNVIEIVNQTPVDYGFVKIELLVENEKNFYDINGNLNPELTEKEEGKKEILQVDNEYGFIWTMPDQVKSPE